MRVAHRSLLWVKPGVPEKVGDGTKWPVGLTRGQLSAWIFRTKRLSFDLPAASGSGSYAHNHGPDSSSISDPWSFNTAGDTVEQEEPDTWRDDTMSYTGPRFTIDSDQYAVGTGILDRAEAGTKDFHQYIWDPDTESWVRVDSPTEYFDVSMVVRVSSRIGPEMRIGPNDGEPIYLVEGRYYPPLKITLGVSMTSIDVGMDVSSDWEQFPVDSTVDYTDSALSLSTTFFGESLTLKGRCRMWHDGSWDYSGTAGFSGGLAIAPAEWRDYGGLWDSATGEVVGTWAGGS